MISEFCDKDWVDVIIPFGVGCDELGLLTCKAIMLVKPEVRAKFADAYLEVETYVRDSL